MKVCVELVGLPEDTATEVRDKVQSDWPRNTVFISPDDPAPNGIDCLLIVARGNSGPNEEEFALVEKIDTEHQDQEQIMFQVNAKLGKLTRSDLVRAKPSSFLNDKSKQVSRRDLFSGLRSGFTTYSDSPFVFQTQCETKFGCSKCVDICPAKALKSINGSITVNEAECTRCGLCAATCPVSAIQMPRFSEDAFQGLINGIDRSSTPRKTLVLTCDSGKVDSEPYMCVEQVKDVGLIGSRHLAIAASSSLGAVIVYCADGKCVGKEKAKERAERISALLSHERLSISYLEGEQDSEKIKAIHAMSKPQSRKAELTNQAWINYGKSLKSIWKNDATTLGLGLTRLDISDSCTLCKACVVNCPHSSLRVDTGKLSHDSTTCTGCGMCAKICPEKAIQLHSLDKSEEFVMKVVYEDEIVNCARCGNPLESARFLKKVRALAEKDDPMMKYCDPCKQQIAFQKLLGASSSK